MKKKNHEMPKLQIISFDSENVLTASAAVPPEEHSGAVTSAIARLTDETSIAENNIFKFTF